jgi:hypothetical protein
MSAGWWLLVVVVVLLLLVGLYLSMTAGRLDRLHQRIDTARLTLQSQLLRRSSVCIELSAGQWLDPAASLLMADVAHRARTSADEGPDAQARAESDLTAVLREAVDPEELAEIAATDDGPELLAELDAACLRVQLSRRFYNDAVRACRQVRSRWMVRTFRLAGHTPLPEFWEIDDSLPSIESVR